MFIAGEYRREREREVKGPALWELAVRVCARTYPRPRARTKTIARPRGRVTTAGKRYIIAREVFWAGAACSRAERRRFRIGRGKQKGWALAGRLVDAMVDGRDRA